MKQDRRFLQKEKLFELLYYGLTLSAMLFFVFLQPLGEPPDESGRYKIVQYICLNGRLPHGADPAILLHGYGGSYGFQPILTYMIQGFLLRIIFPFVKDGYLLLLCARLVNVIFGMIMAVMIRKTSKLLFEKKETGWLFSVFVMMMPQSLFLHTYINTDSMALMSSSVIVYAWLKGLKSRFDTRNCITLSIGISLCALSYYNAYGFILCSIFIFASSFIEKKDGRWVVDYKALIQKGLLVSAIVLTLISWWFIRNAVLYDGDVLGLKARAECTLLTASEKYHPLTKETYQNTGYSLWYMIFSTDFIELLSNSFIATFGPMSIVTYKHIYTVFKWLFLIGGLSLFLPKAKNSALPGYSPFSKKILHINFAVSIIIPVALCVGYSYMSDYQPQGRYILVMILPFAYFLALGIEKLTSFFETKRKLVYGLIIAFYQYALWVTLIRIVFVVYYETSILYYIRHHL